MSKHNKLLLATAAGIAMSAPSIIGACLSVVQRKQPTGWARVWNGGLMFDDMDLATILPLAVQVIAANLWPFIQGLLTSQQSGPEATQAG